MQMNADKNNNLRLVMTHSGVLLFARTWLFISAIHHFIEYCQTVIGVHLRLSAVKKSFFEYILC